MIQRIQKATDLTLTDSRNAHLALVLWSYISMYSYDEQVKMQ